MWDNSHRPEQLFTRDFLKQLFPNSIIETEYPINNLKIDGKPYRRCILDIAIKDKKWAIRLNGEYHNGKTQTIKDEYQKIALEQAGWKVIDFDYFMMPNLFKKKKNDKVIVLAKEEINNILEKFTT